MKWEALKKPLAKFGMWAIRVLIREGKEEMAKFAVDEVVKDEKIPMVKTVGDFVRKNFSARIGNRGF